MANISYKIREAKLRWLGHIERKRGEVCFKKIHEGERSAVRRSTLLSVLLSAQYNRSGLTTMLYSIQLIFTLIPLSHSTPGPLFPMFSIHQSM